MKKTVIAGIILIALALAGVIALVSNVDTYKTFKSAQELPEGKSSTVVGKLTQIHKIEYNPELNPNLTTFYAEDKEGMVMKVRYTQPKPIDFERSEELTMTGEVINGEFHTDKILMKCPSKYIDEELTPENQRELDKANGKVASN